MARLLVAAVSAALLVSSVFATPLERRTVTGRATWYNVETGTPTACGTIVKNDDPVVAVGADVFDAQNCGKVVEITDPTTGKKVCGIYSESCAPYLSPSLFEQLGSLSLGLINGVEWEVKDTCDA
ncbi:hypothetical protein CC1G_05043 [Coprinopsis cinerea okayama7|uniref:Barwin domain-containing protein n=1 Tax=Coprinopsis cinerea (strain Okayama-7 / 130 / ATCC MYA-4618 / FGSC 9003) TaxID=240176 RepID=A8NSN3_COPC7|nr:hypothetical protein CC1G_05043 [Coprinopsis cinerea okayama7\|eukprot:XP_001836050.2 hypothetical protein CC1G_05043 [Coprinopsis cinerea okayama7\